MLSVADFLNCFKVYPKSEWEECVASYDMILELAKYMEGFLVNMKGMPLRVNRKIIEFVYPYLELILLGLRILYE